MRTRSHSLYYSLVTFNVQLYSHCQGLQSSFIWICCPLKSEAFKNVFKWINASFAIQGGWKPFLEVDPPRKCSSKWINSFDIFFDQKVPFNFIMTSVVKQHLLVIKLINVLQGLRQVLS